MEADPCVGASATAAVAADGDVVASVLGPEHAGLEPLAEALGNAGACEECDVPLAEHSDAGPADAERALWLSFLCRSLGRRWWEEEIQKM